MSLAPSPIPPARAATAGSQAPTHHRQAGKEFTEAARVVNGVDINVKRGEIVGLLGPNGAGKTTTFYMIVGLIRPNGGRVIFEDRDVTRDGDVSPGTRRHGLSAAGGIDLSEAHRP